MASIMMKLRLRFRRFNPRANTLPTSTVWKTETQEDWVDEFGNKWEIQ